MPNASVTITNEGTGVSDKMTTTAQGFYTFATLTPGQYSLSVEMPGFKTTVSRGNVVLVEQSTRVDITLSPGQVNQQVTVLGETPLVETTTSDLGQTIDSTQINALPVNGRLFETLMQIAPGTTPAAWGDQIENVSIVGDGLIIGKALRGRGAGDGYGAARPAARDDGARRDSAVRRSLGTEGGRLAPLTQRLSDPPNDPDWS